MNVAFNGPKFRGRNTLKLRKDRAKVALYEEGFDFVLRSIFFIVLALHCLSS